MGSYRRLLNKAIFNDEQLIQDIHKIGSNIKDIRIQNQLSIDEIASLTNMAHSTYYRMEQGEINMGVKSLMKIQHVFGLAPNEIIPHDEKVESYVNEYINLTKGLRADQIRYINEHIASLVKLMK